MPIAALPLPLAFAERLGGNPLLLLLDLDGTVCPIAPRPEYAVVSVDTHRVLGELAALSGVHLVVMTGRTAEDARRLLCVDKAWIIGNHGFEVAPPNDPPTARGDVALFRDRIVSAVARCNEIAGQHAGIIVEDKRWTLSVHYRLAHPRIVPQLRADVAAAANSLGLRMTHEQEVIELTPPIEIDKGTAATDLTSTLGGLAPHASLLCAGDDRADEDVFRALCAVQPRCVTVRIGADSAAPDTVAEFCVSDTDALRELLEQILALRQES